MTLFFSRDFPVVEYFKVSNLYHNLSLLQMWYIMFGLKKICWSYIGYLQFVE